MLTPWSSRTVPLLLIVILLILAPGCQRPLSTAACTEDGSVQADSVTAPDGFTVPFQYYLPPCYEQMTASYPVLYLIHGQGGDETNWFALGRAAEIANQMIRTTEVPPIIIITPRVDYYRDSQYMDVAEVLIPYADGHFRTLADREHRAVGGASAGADLAACLAFLYPDLFGSAGAFAGGWCLNSQQLIDAIPTDRRPRVFIDAGDRDAAEAFESRRRAETLERNGFSYVLNIGSGDHSYTYWSTNLPMYLRWCAEGW